MNLQQQPQTKIGYNSVRINSTTRYIGHGEFIERKVTENCIHYKTSFRDDHSEKISTIYGVFPETSFWEGEWLSEDIYVIKSTRVSKKTIKGEYLINCYSVGATDTIVFEAWKKAPGRKKSLYSRLTSFEQEFYGRVGSKYLPKGINDIALDECSFKIEKDFRNSEYNKAYKLILSLYHHAVMGKTDCGVIELSISKMDRSIEDSEHFSEDEYVGNVGGRVLDGKPDVRCEYESVVVGGKESDVAQISQGFGKDLWELIC